MSEQKNRDVSFQANVILSILSPIEMKPATDYRNNPASEFYVRCFEERGIFLFKQARYQRVTAGLFERKMPTYADYGGWVISMIAGWVEVIADTISSPPEIPHRPTHWINQGLWWTGLISNLNSRLAREHS